jgi:hypothetical protein
VEQVCQTWVRKDPARDSFWLLMARSYRSFLSRCCRSTRTATASTGIHFTVPRQPREPRRCLPCRRTDSDRAAPRMSLIRRNIPVDQDCVAIESRGHMRVCRRKTQKSSDRPGRRGSRGQLPADYAAPIVPPCELSTDHRRQLTCQYFGHKLTAVSTERYAAGVAIVTVYDGAPPAG